MLRPPLFAAHLGLLYPHHSMGYWNFTRQSCNWKRQLFLDQRMFFPGHVLYEFAWIFRSWASIIILTIKMAVLNIDHFLAHGGAHKYWFQPDHADTDTLVLGSLCSAYPTFLSLTFSGCLSSFSLSSFRPPSNSMPSFLQEPLIREEK